MGPERTVTVVRHVFILLAFILVTNACPYPCTCAEFKVNCYSKGLKEIPANFPPDVVTIDLQYNEIESVGDQFHNLTMLQDVMLRFNHITHLAEGAFSHLPRLTHVNLGTNAITNLSAGTFHNVSSMSILDLTDNQLTTVDDSFQGLSSLTKLVLTRNHIEELTEHSLQPLTSLVYFMADENQIAHVHPAAFHSLKNLSYVSLIKNPLGTMDGVLSGNTGLFYLNLEDCELSHVPTGLPWATRNLQLRRNNITTISGDTFASTQYLGVINLDENQITRVDADAFTPIAHLQEVWLNGNQLSALPTPIPSTLQTLSMDNNHITTISHDDFPHDSQMKVLSLKGNKLSKIDPFTFSRLVVLQKLYLSDNAITVLQDRGFLGMRNLTLLDVGNNPVTHIDVRFAAGLHKLAVLDLSFIKDSEPFMEGNFFRDIPFLRTLLLRSSPSLARNILTSNETLKSFYHLREMDIRDNNLQTIDVDLPRFFTGLQQLQLLGNAWVCDPRLLWLHDWMQTSRDVFVDIDQVVCATPSHLAGKVIADLPYHAFFYTTTLPTTSTTHKTDQTGDGNETEVTTNSTFLDLTTVLVSSAPTQSDTGDSQTTVSLPTPDGVTEQEAVSDELYTTSDTGHYQTGSTTSQMTKQTTGVTNITMETPVLTSLLHSTAGTTEKSSQGEGHTTTPTAEWTETGTEKEATSTSLTKTSREPTTQPPLTSTMSTTSPSSFSHLSTAPNTTTTTTTTTSHPQPTDIPRHGGSKTHTDAHSSSFTHTVIIATCVAVIMLIIIVVALLLVLRNKGKIRMAFHRALAPKGDTEFVLCDQDEPDSRPDTCPMTNMSGSEQGSTPSVEIASDDGLCTKLV